MENGLPVGWQRKRLDQIADFLDGQRKPIKEGDRQSIQGEYPYYGASGIIDYVNDYLFDDELILLGEDGANIVNRSSPLAFRVSGKCWVNNHAHVIKPKPGTEIDFLVEYLESLDYSGLNSGTAQPKLNLASCQSIPVLVPPVEEQKAIAAVLSTWDRGIRQLTDLIAAKLRFKQGLMQQLLTGKRRFKGFSDEWESVRLGDVVEVRFSGVDKLSVAGETPIRLCNYMDVYSNEMITSQIEFMQATAKSTEIANFSLMKWDVLITKDSETPDDIAKAAYVADDLDGVVLGYHVGLLRPTPRIHGPFLSRLLMIPQMRYRFTQIANGVTRYGLPLAATRLIRMRIPNCLEEQKRIAGIADQLDREIDILRRQLDALKTQKKGLMQKLLTGQVRVKLPEGGG